MAMGEGVVLEEGGGDTGQWSEVLLAGYRKSC